MSKLLHQLVAPDGFRLRGTAMSRVDGFSDVVFGFALTLLVVSLEVPKTYDEFHHVLLGFFPFSVCFVLLIGVWFAHYRFFRRFGMHDSATILINSALLFTLLFFVYPLKFLFTIAIGGVQDAQVFTAAWQLRELMVIYGVGSFAIYFCLAALYMNAWRQREALDLNEIERMITRGDVISLLGTAFVGIISVIVACILPAEHSGYAGYCYFLIGVWLTVMGTITGRKVRAEQKRVALLDAVSE